MRSSRVHVSYGEGVGVIWRGVGTLHGKRISCLWLYDSDRILQHGNLHLEVQDDQDKEGISFISLGSVKSDVPL
jgi:hypothetical protein